MNPEPSNASPSSAPDKSDNSAQPQAVRYIAVDANGVPLPNQPANIQPVEAAPQSGQPQVVYMTRPLDPEAPQLSDAAKERHEHSRKQFPHLNLSDGEYIVSAVRRHPIGLFSIWAVTGIVLVILAAALIAYASYASRATDNGTNIPSVGVFAGLDVLLMVLTFIGGYIATVVYQGNKFFLTNESVIQEIQTSLFARHEQTVSLSNIEDASYSQNGIIQSLIGYGSIRLSTEGDETTYRFQYVANPKRQIALLNNAVEAFKNGRPVVND